MIVVKVELHSSVTLEVTELGRTVIYNDGTGTGARGNYWANVCRRGSTDYTKPTRVGRVVAYPRTAYNVWRLVIRALRSAFPEEK